VSCTVVITQPTYLPWLGYFEQMARADKFIFLDSVQFERRSWQCRNRLKDAREEPFWLTVPLQAQPQSTLIQDIRISTDQPHWRKKHLVSLQTCFAHAPFFPAVFPAFQQWLEADQAMLAELNIAGIKMTAELLGLRPQFLRASQLGVNGRRSELLVNLCRAVGATHYYSALGSKSYLEEVLFTEHQISVAFQTWEHPAYTQSGITFVSHLAAVDALMNLGPAATRALLSTP